VAWQRLEVSDKEIAEGTKRFQKKARFLVDEDIHAKTATFVRVTVETSKPRLMLV